MDMGHQIWPELVKTVTPGPTRPSAWALEIYGRLRRPLLEGPGVLYKAWAAFQTRVSETGSEDPGWPRETKPGDEPICHKAQGRQPFSEEGTARP